MPPSQVRRPLRARRRDAHHERRSFARSPESPTRAPSPLGQSLYAALDRGRIDAEALRKLLTRHPLTSGGAEPLVFAVDASVWPRCDAETSPERGFYYHPSRHSAGQPIVAGWAYQFVAQLGFARESWTAPVDVERVRPGSTCT